MTTPAPRFRTRLLALDGLADLAREMQRLEADKGGITLMAAKGVCRCILVEQVPVKAANLIKQEILARGGDLVTPWTCADFAVESVDVIVLGNLTTLRSLISKLYRQHVYHLREFADALQACLLHTVEGFLPVARQPSRQGIVVEETLDDWAGGRIAVGPGGRSKALPPLAALGGVNPADGPQLAAWVDSPVAVQRALASGAVLLLAGALPLPAVEALVAEAEMVPVAAAASDARSAAAALTAGVRVVHTAAGQAELRGVANVVGDQDAHLLLGLPTAEVAGDWLSNLHRNLDHALQELHAAAFPADRVLLHLALPAAAPSWQQNLVLRRLREFTSYGRTLVAEPAALAPAEQEPAAAALAVQSGAHLVLTPRPAALAPTLAWAHSLLGIEPAPPETKG